MSKIEGELRINEYGKYQVGNRAVDPGSIIEVQSGNDWIDVCIEEAHGIHYSIPQIDLRIGLTARMEEWTESRTICPVGRI